MPDSSSINSWEDVGSWDSEDALVLSSLWSRLEAIRKALIERIDLCGAEYTGFLREPVAPLARTVAVMGELDSMLSIAIPYFIHFSDNKIKEMTVSGGNHTINDADIDSFSDSYSYTTLSAGDGEAAISFSDGLLTYSDTTIEPYYQKIYRYTDIAGDIRFKTWTRSELEAVSGTISMPVLCQESVILKRLYTAVNLLRIPAGTINISVRETGAHIWRQIVAYYLEGTTQYRYSVQATQWADGGDWGTLSLEEIWERCYPVSRFPHSSSVQAFCVDRSISEPENYSENYYDIGRESLSLTLTNTSSALGAQIPLKASYFMITKHHAATAYNSEPGAEGSDIEAYEGTIDAGADSDTIEMGMENRSTIPPMMTSWYVEKLKRKYDIEFQINSDFGLKFIV